MPIKRSSFVLLGALVVAACGPAVVMQPGTTTITPDLDASAPTASTTAPLPTTTGEDAAPPVDAGAAGDAAVATDAAAAGDAGPSAFRPSTCVRKDVTLSKDVQPILRAGCGGFEGCHGIKTGSADSVYKWVVGVATTSCPDGRKLVAPSDPQHSYVIDKLTNHDICKGSPMPKPLGTRAWQQLPETSVQTIYDWVCEGAPNN